MTVKYRSFYSSFTQIATDQDKSDSMPYTQKLNNWMIKDMERIEKENLANRGFKEPYDFHVEVDDKYFIPPVLCHFCHVDVVHGDDDHVYELRKYVGLITKTRAQCHGSCFEYEIGLSTLAYSSSYEKTVECYLCNKITYNRPSEIVYEIDKRIVSNRDKGNLVIVGRIRFCSDCWENMAGNSFFDMK